MSTDGIEQFVLDNVPGRSHIGAAVIEEAARRRGFAVTRNSKRILIVHADGVALSFRDLNGPDTSLVGRLFCAALDEQRRVLESRGLPVPRSATFVAHQQELAQEYATDLNGPVAVKPARLDGVRGITPDVQDEAAFRRAWRRAVAAYDATEARTPVLVEEQVPGDFLHIFVVDDTVVAVTHKVPANVVGDGSSSIDELIQQKNAARARNALLRQYPIPRRLTALGALHRAGGRLSDIPGNGQQILLRLRPNASTGGDLVDVTRQVDTRVQQLAVDAIRATPGAAYGAVDVLVPQDDPAGAVVVEVESAPAPLACFPSHGQPRDLGSAILDHYLHSPRWERSQESLQPASPPTGQSYGEALHLVH